MCMPQSRLEPAEPGQSQLAAECTRKCTRNVVCTMVSNGINNLLQVQLHPISPQADGRDRSSNRRFCCRRQRGGSGAAAVVSSSLRFEALLHGKRLARNEKPRLHRPSGGRRKIEQMPGSGRSPEENFGVRQARAGSCQHSWRVPMPPRLAL